MKETIYLRVSRTKVEGMTKNLPYLNRGEIPVKLEIDVAPEAFREPVISKKVTINDWREGIDIADVEFKESVITQDEADRIKEMRLKKMQTILEEQGYTITKPEVTNDKE